MYWRKIFITIFFGLIFSFSALFAEQNLEILKAMMLADKGELVEASKIYENLYDKSKDKVFLKESLGLAIESGNEKSINKLLKKGEKILNNDNDFMRVKILHLISKMKLKEAKNLTNDLISKDQNDSRNFIMLGEINIFLNENKEALDNFKKAYEIDASEYNVERLSSFLLVNFKDTKEAKRYLEDFKIQNGCTINVCDTLSEIYRQNKEFKSFAKINEELYDIDNEQETLNKAIVGYVTANNLDDFKDFVKRHNIDNETAMSGYAQLGDFKSAIDIANLLFENTQDSKFQALMAIYEYESKSQIKKPENDELKNIIKNFEASVKKANQDVFFNYYGYLLIDHDIDIKKGIELVKKALEISPNSPYYLDSLAWGYYKIKECDMAKEQMNMALKHEGFAQEIEAKLHKNAIDECKSKEQK